MWSALYFDPMIMLLLMTAVEYVFGNKEHREGWPVMVFFAFIPVANIFWVIITCFEWSKAIMKRF